MKNFIQFINDFLNRSGSYVFTTTIASRLLSFFASWIALQLIPNKELGIVIYAFQAILFIIPMGSLGLNQGLLRYGSQLKSNKEKDTLFNYILKKGILISLIITVIIIITVYLLNFELNETHFYLILLSLMITSSFIFEIIKIQFRLQKNNKLFSIAELFYNILLVFFVFTLSYNFKELGYAIALIITPFISSLIFIPKLNISWGKPKKLTFINYKFFRYGFFASLSNVTTQLLISIDIILLGFILKDMELVTAFKYVSLVPYSLLFLSNVVITTDFVNFTEKIEDSIYIKSYIINYIKLFSSISFACIIVIYFFGEFILSFFEKSYISYFSSLMVLTIGVSGILILRGLFGNLLSSIGKAHINFSITTLALALNIVLNYYFIPKYGILGAATTSAIIMWFTGFLSFLLFFYFYKKLYFKKL
ncbi:polysaccharide biosynthesis C-terminal domain-containing protein [Lutibacter sp.]|uniref:oligosaccharide flippase family protein n=1 Tax=Lutibacter sp. TaxID=1925666 RepID=UPI0025C2E63F|nr:polysaccharide biosynthesis C-terminal domain-containing protein [Lutibacter sp.]MCF6181147.1 polysaccharide biosynthesis C-terminal domain-containing protein [Lutibacter sp.]